MSRSRSRRTGTRGSLGLHSYLTYLRQRLVAARDLLKESGSIVVQVGPDNLHLVRALLDEVFGAENHCATITVAKTSQVTAALLPEVSDFLLWYARDRDQVGASYNQLYEPRLEDAAGGAYQWVEINGERRKMTPAERSDPAALVERGGRIFGLSDATSQGFSATKTVDFEFENRTFHPGLNRHWAAPARRDGGAGCGEAAAGGGQYPALHPLPR